MVDRSGERRGRRRRAGTIAFVLAPGLLIGGGLWAASYPLKELMGGPINTPCVPDVVRAPMQNSFTVNVLNHGGKQGAAARIAKELPRRDFKLGQVGNDPGLTSVNGIGEIRHGPAGLDQALVVQKLLLPDAGLVRDFRFGTSVDLVLGKQFGELAPPVRPMVRRAEVTVNVYNTTYYEGVGKKASKALSDLGFGAGRVGGDPKNTWITDVAAIRYGPDGELAAKLVQSVVPGSRLVANGSLKGTTVDLLIGMKWQGVLPKAQVKPEPPKKPLKPLTVARPCR